MQLKVLLLYFVTHLKSSGAIQCWQCASTEGKICPIEAKQFTSTTHDACITWRLGNGTVLLQNLVMAQEECTDEKISFWSRFVDLYYKTYGGSVSCCYSDSCNDGSIAAYPLYPKPQVPAGQNSLTAGSLSLTRLPDLSSGSLSSAVSNPSFLSSGENLNTVTSLAGYPTQIERAGNCEKYFEKISADEWVPDTLVPLAYDRASEAKVGVFYVKLGERGSNNDHVIVRILNKAKQNLTMYSIKLFRVGTVSIHINKLEMSRKGGQFVKQDGRKSSVNAVIDLDKDKYQGFWISIKNDIEVSIGRIGDKLINSVANFTDILREGPSEPYYFGLTTPAGASASFGVSCEMPGLHFEDTCVTDEDCEEFPETVCRTEPVNKGLDPGTRNIPFDSWKEGDTILKSCWCREGHIRIPESNGCYDPIRKVVTLRDACFADYHCNDLPNTMCVYDLEMSRFNKSCQCIPGNKPFSADPRTGLVEGCAPLTKQDKATVAGCSRKFFVGGAPEWVPKIVFPMEHDELYKADVGVFFITLNEEITGGKDDGDVAVIRLLNGEKDRKKMYTIKIFREDGKIALYESKVTRNFFFSNENDREIAKYEDSQTRRRLEAGYVGFWVQYKYEDGYGGQLSLGLNGAPFSPDFALVKYTDTSTSALPQIKYMGFTLGKKDSHVKFGANCVLLKTQGFRQSPLLQVAQAQYPVYQTPLYYSQGQLLDTEEQTVPESSAVPNLWELVDQAQSEQKTQEYVIKARPEQTVIDPIIKNQYLTKLKRLLPTYLEDLQSDEIVSKLKEVVEDSSV